MTAAARIAHPAHRAEHETPLSRQHERQASSFGMWIFLSTETLFFGVLFVAYSMGRLRFPEAFAAANLHTNLLLGTLNTAVLLSSSACMAMAVQTAKFRRRRATVALLGVTVALGLAFLAIKGLEYRSEYLEHLLPGNDFQFDAALRQGAELFFWMYFVMTGAHAAHLLIGIALVGMLALRLRSGGFARHPAHGVELTGLYWHFVDLVWIFLYPCIYLVARS
jgi:cytochrome c oxidase subunit 3